MKPVTTNSEPDFADPDVIGVPLVEDHAEDAPEIGLARLRLLWERRRMLFRVVVCGLAVSTLIAFLIPKQYQSTARLMPPDNQSSSGLALMAALSAKSSLGALGGNLLGVKSTGALFVGILHSRTVQDRLIEHFDLKKVYGASLSENARRELAQNTSVSEDLKSGIITITVTDHDPKRATQLATAYVDALNLLVVELSTSAAHRERVFLEQRLKDVKQDLDQASKEASEFASKNTAIDIKEQGRAMMDAAANLQGQLIATQSQLKGLEQIYTDNNVRVRTLRARAAELQHQLAVMGGKEGSSSADQGQHDKPLYPSIRELPLLGVTSADLLRRAKIQETVYETLTQEYELAKVQETKEIPSVKVLDAADVPEKKAFPPRLAIMFLGTFLASAAGVVWLLAGARWQEIDPQHPAKKFAEEIAQTVKAEISSVAQNERLRAATARLRRRSADQRQQVIDHGSNGQDPLHRTEHEAANSNDT